MWRLIVGTSLTMVSITALAACGGSGGGTGGSGSPTPPPPIVATYAFPAGDATSAPGGIAWDIVGVKTTLTGTPGSPAGNSYDTLRVDVTFVQDISNALPAPGEPLAGGTELGVGIAIDADGNQNTGVYRTCDSSSTVMPFEYFSDIGTQLGRLGDGNYAIVDPSGNFVSAGGSDPAGEAVTSVSAHVFEQSFFLPSLTVFSGVGIPRIGIGVGSYNGSANTPTDCVPKKPVFELFTNQLK